MLQRNKLNFKRKSTWQLSLIISTILAPSAVYANAVDIETEQKVKLAIADTAIDEKISVYGRHNQLILESGTATKSSMSLMKTPAAIVVVDSALINSQGYDSLQESIRNISGLSQDGNNYGVGDNLAIRGLGVNYTYDGIYGGSDLGNSYNPTRSMTNIESMEVLKGPATGLYGMGAAGGIINLIEKKPQDKASYQVQASLGNWNAHSFMLDATAPLSDSTAYRFVANYESTDGYRGVSAERAEVYASLRHDFSVNNQVTFSAASIDDANQVDSIGHPVRLIDLSLFDTATGDITGADLVNGAAIDSDNNATDALQLTDAQREELAASLSSTDGWQPTDLGDTSLISPISTPNEGKELRLKMRQDLQLSQDWSLIHQLQYRTYESDYIRQTAALNYIYHDRNGVINLDPRAPLVIDGVLYPYAARRQEYRNITADETVWQYFIDLTNRWSSGDIEGEHLLSANYEHHDMNYQQYSIWDADDSRSDPVPYILDIRNPNWPTGEFDDYNPALRSKYNKQVTSWGISAQEVLYFSDALTGRIGGAYTGIKQTYHNQVSDGTPEYDADDSGLSYNLGLSYQVTNQLSIFVNHSMGRTAYSVLGSINGSSDRPDSESESFDLGMRFTAFDQDLLGSLVLFKTSRTNLRYSNPTYEDDPADAAYNIDVPEYYYDEADETQGVEFDLNLALNHAWSMNFNATYQDPITQPGQYASSQDEEQTKGIAKRSASVWTSYDVVFKGLYRPVTFSVGVNYEDERSISASAFGIDYAIVEAYTVWDASVSYQGEEWDLQLNLRNLADTDYYSKAMYLGGLPGESRNAKLTATYNF